MLDLIRSTGDCPIILCSSGRRSLTCDRPQRRWGQMGFNLQMKVDDDDWTAKAVIKPVFTASEWSVRQIWLNMWKQKCSAAFYIPTSPLRPSRFLFIFSINSPLNRLPRLSMCGWVCPLTSLHLRPFHQQQICSGVINLGVHIWLTHNTNINQFMKEIEMETPELSLKINNGIFEI